MYVKIKDEIKKAMIEKDTNKRDVLKMVVDKSRAIMKETNPNNVSENIPNEVVLQAINKELKQLHQTLEILDKNGAAKDLNLRLSTTHKITLLSAYLPKQMTEEEIAAYVESELVELTGTNVIIPPKIKGVLMKNIMPKLKGKADSKLINKVVDKCLSN